MDTNIAIVTHPITSSGIIPLSNLVKILCSIPAKIVLITGGDAYEFFKDDTTVKSIEISYSGHPFPPLRALKYAVLQFRMASLILKTAENVERYIFFFGGDTYVIPVLTARLLRKNVSILVTGSSIKTYESKHDPLINGLKVLRFLTCACATSIIMYNKRLIADYSLYRWSRKIFIAHHHSIDLDRFNRYTDYPDRDQVVGYVGRFGEEKGIMQLVRAVEQIVESDATVRFVFIGDGKLRPAIEQYLSAHHLDKTVTLPGWVPHDALPDLLNAMRLLVIPSDTEGLPNVMLEAMACGTPVLATPVGAIPDIIRDGTTGFIMHENGPECIATNVTKALSSPDLERVAENAKQVVEKCFSFERVLVRWKEVLEETHDGSEGAGQPTRPG